MVVLPPPQPAKAAATPTVRRAQAKAYARRRRVGALLRRMTMIRSRAKTQVMRVVSGAAGRTFGVRDGLKKPGGAFESAGESDAIQVATVVEVPAVAVQLAGEPRA